MKQPFSIRRSPRPRTISTGPTILLTTLLTAGAIPAEQAQADDAVTVRSVREELSDYGAGQAHGLSALTTLTKVVMSPGKPSRYRKEARFLRAAIAADLHFLSRYQSPELDAYVAQALGMKRSEARRLNAAIQRELSAFTRGVFAQPAKRVRALLSITETSRSEDLPSLLAQRPSTARDALLLRQAAEALHKGSDLSSLAYALGQRAQVSVPSLQARISKDVAPAPPPKGATQPGAKVVIAPTPGRRPSHQAEQDLSRLSEDSRRLLAGLRELEQAFGRLRAAASSGDLLARSLRIGAEGHIRTLSTQRVAVAERLSGTLTPEAPSDLGQPVVPRLFLVLTDKGVDYAVAPYLRVNATGKVQLKRDPHTWPQTTRVQVPRDHWRLAEHRAELTEVVRPICGGDRNAVIGLLTDDKAKTAQLTGLLHALKGAECGPVALIARGDGDTPVGLPIEPILRSEAADDSHPIEVRLKPRGYSIATRGHVIECPRERGKGGRPYFKFKRLDRILSAKRRSTKRSDVAMVSYVGWSRLSDLFTVLWRTAAPSKPVRVKIP
ncbi:MAG: hypothetical protein OXU20_12180 [Myxococcales bacterium]|nr:hypothetical protein [Myxococcales bacterium]